MRFGANTVDDALRPKPSCCALSLAPILVLAVTLGGCALGVTHRYHDTIADLSAQPGEVKAVAVAVRDSRPYILDGGKPPTCRR